jgi:hypothetical protein
MEQRTVRTDFPGQDLVAASLIPEHAINVAVERPRLGEEEALSADDLALRANTTTEVLEHILQQAAVSHDFRHWGINE